MFLFCACILNKKNQQLKMILELKIKFIYKWRKFKILEPRLIYDKIMNAENSELEALDLL